MPMYNPAEDLEGYIRGPHKDGEDVCKGFVFHVPGSQSTPEKTIWGWNDTLALYCEKCGALATEHIVLRAPPKPKDQEEKKKAPARRTRADADPTRAVDPTAANPTDMDDTVQRKEREAQQAALINAGYDGSGMLNDYNDPLAYMPAPVAPAAPPAAATGADEEVGSSLQELLSRDASANEEFKREIERMIRETNRKEELDAHTKTSSKGMAGGVLDSKDLSGATVPIGTFADAGALLRSVGLERYEQMFADEEMDPDTLIEVLQQQGKASLEESLKELGIKSMGHRLKIVNAMIIQ